MTISSGPEYLIVWDFDGCLYRYDALPNKGFFHLCDSALAKAASSVLPGIDYHHAIKLAQLSFRKYHDACGAFMDYAEEINRNPIEIRDALFPLYHQKLWQMLEKRHPDFFDDTETREAFEKTAGCFRHAISSHGCRTSFIIPGLKKMGIYDYFDPTLIFDMSDNGYARKSEDAAHIQKIMDISNFTPDNTIFVEDSHRNIGPAVQLGVRAALLHYDNPPPTSLEGVTWVSSTPAALLNQLHAELILKKDLVREFRPTTKFCISSKLKILDI